MQEVCREDDGLSVLFEIQNELAKAFHAFATADYRFEELNAIASQRASRADKVRMLVALWRPR